MTISGESRGGEAAGTFAIEHQMADHDHVGEVFGQKRAVGFQFRLRPGERDVGQHPVAVEDKSSRGRGKCFGAVRMPARAVRLDEGAGRRRSRSGRPRHRRAGAGR